MKVLNSLLFLILCSSCGVRKYINYDPLSIVEPPSIEDSNTYFLEGTGYPVSVDRIAYDGSRIVHPVLFTNDSGDSLSFRLYNGSLSFLGMGYSAFEGISTVLSITSPALGVVSVYWKRGEQYLLSNWESGNGGSILSGMPLDISSFGCSSRNEIQLASCGGLYFGACRTSYGAVRLFSFNSYSKMVSAVTTSINEGSNVPPSGLTCMNGDLIIAAGMQGSLSELTFYRYSLNLEAINFVRPENENKHYDGVNPYYSPVFSIASDGNSLILNQGTLIRSGRLSIRITKMNIGGL